MRPIRTVLLVQPPMQHPALFSPTYISAAASFQRLPDMRIRHLHAGNDFITYLARPQVRREFCSRIRQRLSSGEYGKARDASAQKAEWLSSSRLDPWEPLQLHAEAFFEPGSAGGLFEQIDQAFAVASCAFSPAFLDRRSFNFPGLDSAQALLRLADDADLNPFRDYALHHSSAASPEPCDLVLFAVDRPGQLPGALTLARAWRARQPDAALAVWASDERLQHLAEELMPLPRHGAAEQVRTWRLALRHSSGFDSQNDDLGRRDPAADPLLLPAAMIDAGVRAMVRTGRLDPEAMRAILAASESDAARVVVWHAPRGDSRTISRLLYEASARGLWNHVVIADPSPDETSEDLLRFAAANPNIIHSCCRRIAAPSFYSDARDIYPSTPPAYGQTQALPGVALWQRLQDPIYIQAFLTRMEAKALARIFLIGDAARAHSIGSRLSYHFLAPEHLPPGYLEEICRMVDAGGSVQPQWVRYNLERAFLIGYVEENGIIVGNSSLKHPRQEYIQAVSRQTGIDLSDYLERGYTSVRPQYRSLGIGAKLLEGLTQRAGEHKIFSIIAEDNLATQKMALRNRTRKVAAFFSERSQKQIGIWIPEWMLPQGRE